MDLSEAFDTVDFNILQGKLHHSGIRVTAYNCFKSYLYSRQQYVFINHHESQIKDVKHGVPQGSSLGPLLFIINNLVNSSKIFHKVILADDTNLFLSHTNLSELENIINTELQEINTWFKCHKLSLNISKTNLILFRPNKSVPLIDHINLKIENEVLKRVNFIAYLKNQKKTFCSC